jgi:hypothetical protein
VGPRPYRTGLRVRRALWQILAWIAALGSALSWRLAVRLSCTHQSGELVVSCLYRDDRHDQVLRKLQAVFDVIVQSDPRRWARMSTDLERVLVSHAGGPEFIPAVWGCLLASHEILGATISELALVLAHEATHARLCRAAVRATYARRERIEALCLSAEADLAARLPDSRAALSLVHSKMDGRAWWTDDALATRRDDELASLGMPRWFVRFARKAREFVRSNNNAT